MITKIRKKISALQEKEEKLAEKAEVECNRIEKQIEELRSLEQEIEKGQEQVKDLRDALEFLEHKDNSNNRITFYVQFSSEYAIVHSDNWTMSPEELTPEGFAFLSKLINAELAEAETRLTELEKRM